MSDIGAQLRRLVTTVYDASYPPSALSGVRLTSLTPNTLDSGDPPPHMATARGSGFEDGCRLVALPGGNVFPMSQDATFISDTEVAFQLHDALGSAFIYRVAVENPGGALSNTIPLRITEPPLPVATHVVPTVITQAAGQTFVLHGTDLDQVTTVTLNGTSAMSFTMIDSTALNVVADATTDQFVQVIASDAQGHNTTPIEIERTP